MYGSFAYGYDKIMSGNDYNKFVSYYLAIFKKYKINPKLILDLGCGTGNITSLMADKGFDMIGVDFSQDMLETALLKNKRKNILYLNQSMESFELYGTVDVIYSALDCINYVTSKNNLKKVFKLCHNYLNYDGLLIFDVNTKYYFEKHLNENTFIYDKDDVYMVWQNQFNKKTNICTFFIDMFYKKDRSYSRFYEEHNERAYSNQELKEMLINAKLEVLGTFSEFSFKKPTDKTKRVFFIARKTKPK